ncbi:hypothetical protein GLOTRDRAFT_80307 [Gloeophyllum trabeum ATCC 11539]|uniref:Uncharacterized protein n=1 Tax=Gloeophyllum trabeum (strain ATCC 11539 / FP-39264 / Madison 617) TaxID=670483 RepID=S7PXT1_GLOTA|nr:uncharacterized protein GLOTRDRAFT_80307 [Gloeophyllum trabeum ATCC 11539]EPQ52132.1 hypothetical protein GLOTRDRAFT_80307 [Gloeophyllum trabeum ATCC 11539]
MTPRPRLRLDAGEPAPPPSSFPSASALAEGPSYPHTSTFRSLQIEISIRSLSVKSERVPHQQQARSLPVFGDSDRVTGTVALAQSFAQTGRLTITLEGAFTYISPDVGAYEPSSKGRQRHVFYSSSRVVPLSGALDSPRSALNIRDAFVATVRRRPSLPTVGGSDMKVIPFNFELPSPTRPGEELPPTFSSSVLMEGGVRSRAQAENAEVSYRVVALWEAMDHSEDRSLLEAPIIVHPDTEFSSLDGLAYEPESWVEIPLKSERSIPFQCAITLPSPAVFPRTASLPFFVVFTTTPRSSTLAREIASDATITVSLLRNVHINASPFGLPTPPPSPPTTEESDAQSPASTSSRLLKRMVRNNTPPVVPVMRNSRALDINIRPRVRSRSRSLTRTLSRSSINEFKDKPLPRAPPPHTPATVFSESRTLQTEVCVGFPKRPRVKQDNGRGHPKLEVYEKLPDGLYKGKIHLYKGMIPGIDWSGLTVKYYLEVSVLFGQDDLRARVPIRLY